MKASRCVPSSQANGQGAACGPPLEEVKRKQTFPGCAQRSRPDNQARRTSEPKWAPMGNQAENRGPAGMARQAPSQAQAAPGTSSGPPACPPAPSCCWDTGRVTGEAGCQIMGWEGRPLTGLGPAWGCPARPGPAKALTRQPSTTPLSGRQTISPFSPRAAWLASAPISP